MRGEFLSLKLPYIVKHCLHVCLVYVVIAVHASAQAEAADNGDSGTAAIEATSSVGTGVAFQSSFKCQVAGDKLSYHVDGFRVGY